MLHSCAECGAAFTCNGGRGSDCTCGELQRPRALRKCRLCRRDEIIREGVAPPLRNIGDPHAPIDVREAEVCRCNKCERQLGRVRFI